MTFFRSFLNKKLNNNILCKTLALSYENKVRKYIFGSTKKGVMKAKSKLLKTDRIQIRVQPSVKSVLCGLAKNQNVSFTDYLECVIFEHLRKQGVSIIEQVVFLK